MSYILIKDIRLPITAGDEEAIHQAKIKLEGVIGNAHIRGFEIHKRSIDARRRGNITVVWSVTAELSCDVEPDILEKAGLSVLAGSDLNTESGSEQLKARPVICGFGPAGMFAALLLVFLRAL